MDQNITIQDLKNLLAELVLSQKETDTKFKETDAKFKETDIRIKQAFELFESQWGKLIESLVEGDLIGLLRSRNIDITDLSTRRRGRKLNVDFEFDIIAHNSNEIVIVEVKTTLKVKHIKKFIERLKLAKQLLPEYKNYNIYGAVAFLRADEESDKYADRQKLFVIRATGDSASIMNEVDFQPKAF